MSDEGTFDWYPARADDVDTSHEQAERKQATALSRSDHLVAFVAGEEEQGATITEISYETGLQKSDFSSLLTKLGREGRLVRLQEKRGGCHVWVHPQWQHERQELEVKPKAERQQHDTDKLLEQAETVACYLEGLQHYNKVKVVRALAQALREARRTIATRLDREEALERELQRADYALRRAVEERDELRAKLERVQCICADGGPGSYEGPMRDCPVHGKERAEAEPECCVHPMPTWVSRGTQKCANCGVVLND